MQANAPKVFFDLEFQFRNGSPLCLSVEEGRDQIAADDVRVRLELHLSPGVVEEVIVTRSELAYMRIIRREVQPEARTEDAGSIRLTGDAKRSLDAKAAQIYSGRNWPT